jgi:hypothetical protein
MLITNGTPRCSATWAMAAAAPGRTATARSRFLDQLARVRANVDVGLGVGVHQLDVDAQHLMTPGARSAPSGTTAR